MPESTNGPPLNTALAWLRHVLAEEQPGIESPRPGRRRFSEGEIGLVWADVPRGEGTGPSLTTGARRFVVPPGDDPAAQPATSPTRSWVEESALVLDDGDSEVTLILGTEIRHLPRGEGGEDLLARATQAVAAWRRAQVKLERRAARADALLSYAEALHTARTPAQVAEALAAHGAQLVGGRAALAFLPEQPLAGGTPAAPEAGELVFRPQGREHGFVEMRLPGRLRRSGSGVLEPVDVVEGTLFAPLEPLFTAHGATHVAHATIGAFGLLLITERRATRRFEAEDWEIMHAIARHAEMTLQRVAATV